MAQLVLYIIKIDKNERTREEIDVITAVTGNLKFFQQLNSKQRNIDNHLHEKISQNLEHEFYPQGTVIFKQGMTSSLARRPAQEVLHHH